MGWWRINDVEYSGINLPIPSRGGKKPMYNGDRPADIMDVAIHEIITAYKAEWKRKPYRDELLACFNFSVNPHYRKRGKK